MKCSRQLNSLRRDMLTMKKQKKTLTPSEQTNEKYKIFDNKENIQPKFKVGDMVHRKLDYPVDILGNKIAGSSNFRTGDLRYELGKRAVIKLLYFPAHTYKNDSSKYESSMYRYMLDGLPNASYTENQLRLK